MSNVRVLLANRPRMLRQSLCRILERQADFEVETVDPDPVDLLAAVDRTDADVVIVTLPESGDDPGISTHLLLEFPGLRVIAISAVEQRAALFRQVITREELTPLAEDRLLAAIRRCQDEKQRFADGQPGGRREGFPREGR